MKVVVTAVGVANHVNAGPLTWPDGWPIPRVDDEVEIPNLPEVAAVRTVVWNPMGSLDEGDEPFVYIVVGPRRR
jgi:hypothetical protein